MARPPANTRLRLAAALGRAAQRASQALGRGNGAVIGGKVASVVCPDVLRRAAAGMPAVGGSGTKGKSTTTPLIRAAPDRLRPPATKIHCANLPNGVGS